MLESAVSGCLLQLNIYGSARVQSTRSNGVMLPFTVLLHHIKSVKPTKLAISCVSQSQLSDYSQTVPQQAVDKLNLQAISHTPVDISLMPSSSTVSTVMPKGFVPYYSASCNRAAVLSASSTSANTLS